MSAVNKYLWEDDRAFARPLFIMLAIMLAMGMLFVLTTENEHFYLGDPNNPNNDDVKFLQTAREFLAGNGIYYNGVPTFIMPLYIIFLSAIMGVAGTDAFLVVRIIQMIMQVIIVYDVYLIARLVFNKKVGMVSVFLSVIYLPHYVAANLALMEVLYSFIYTPLLYLSIIAAKENKVSLYVISGVLWALAIYVRPNAAVFPVVVIFFWIQERYRLKQAMKYVAIVGLVAVALMSPWWVRNYRDSGKFIPLTSSSSSPRMLGMFIWGQRMEYLDDLSLENYYYEEGEKLATNEYLKSSMEHEPVATIAWHSVGKVIQLFIKPYYWREMYGIHINYVSVFHSAYIILGLVGVIFALLVKHKEARKLIAFLATNIAVLLPFITFDRYGYPMMFCFMIFSAYLIQVLGEAVIVKRAEVAKQVDGLVES